jgi:NAD(P)-dependent dehydrogenase (short-subunit alcohol dehydrogenase family)
MSYVTDMFELHEITAVITGGGGILPGAIAEALLKAGAKVSLWGRGRSIAMSDAAAQLEEATGASDRIHYATVDTSGEEETREALEQTSSEFGRPNMLVNGVGGNLGKSDFIDADMDTFKKVLDMNLIAGLMVPTKVFAAYWIDTSIKGSIINIASMSSFIPLSGVWAYDAAKSAVKNLTMASAKEFAPYGIRINAIAPGFFVGKQNKALLIKNEETGELTDRGRAIIDHTPFGRFGEANEVAGSVVFLASPQAAGFITGITLPIDGGYLVDNI